jgi:hypothetical protein
MMPTTPAREVVIPAGSMLFSVMALFDLSKTLLISLFGEGSGQLLMVIRLVIFKDEGFMVFLIKLMFFSALLFISGCGGEVGIIKHPLNGNVSLDGNPLERGTIFFDPLPGIKGDPATGAILNGAYKVELSVGQYLVKINGSKKTGNKMQKAMAPKGEMIDEEVEAVGAAYNSKSNLKQSVVVGDNKGDFAVKSK